MNWFWVARCNIFALLIVINNPGVYIKQVENELPNSLLLREKNGKVRGNLVGAAVA